MFQLKQLVVLVIVVTLLFVGCMPATEDSTSRTQHIINPVSKPLNQNDSGETITVTLENVVLSVQRPPFWESFTTDYGIVLAEELRTVPDDESNNLVVHIFMPPLDNVTLTGDDERVARAILRQIIANPEYINGASTTVPVSIRWQSIDAAYFTMDNGRGEATIVIGLVEPAANKLVVIQMSTATMDAARIRTLLPQIVDRMSINNIELSGNALNAALPTNLPFPHSE
jgi:hypothetical protein